MSLSPQLYARLCGTMYLFIIAAGLFAEFVRERFIVPGNAAATASNIMNETFLYRLGLVADLSTFVCGTAVIAILYMLLRPVSRIAALLMLLFNLVQLAIGGLNVLNTYRPLHLLANAAYLKAFGREQLDALALLSLNSHSIGFGVAMIFFGFSCLALGYLVATSGLFPRVLGVMIATAGVCYLTLSSAQLLAPWLAAALFPAILVPSLVGELSFALWLTVKGVNVARWQDKADHPATSV